MVSEFSDEADVVLEFFLGEDVLLAFSDKKKVVS